MKKQNPHLLLWTAWWGLKKKKKDLTNVASWLFCYVNHSTPAPLGQVD